MAGILLLLLGAAITFAVLESKKKKAEMKSPLLSEKAHFIGKIGKKRALNVTRHTSHVTLSLKNGQPSQADRLSKVHKN